VVGELGAPHDILEEPAVVDEHLRLTLDQDLDALVAEGQVTDAVVQADERDRGDEAGGDGIVASVHGVLDGVGEHEQQHEVERRELANLALAGDAEQDDQQAIDDDRTGDKLPPRDG
jgi:hypothetical protein